MSDLKDVLSPIATIETSPIERKKVACCTPVVTLILTEAEKALRAHI